MSWTKKYKKSIDCNNPKGFSQKAHCAGRKARQSGKQTQSKSVSEMTIEEKLNLFLEKNCPTDKAKWAASTAAARSKFDVYPSAYANGWASKWYKSKGGGWKSTNEEVVNEISNELIGKVNKIRSLYGPKSKTSTASDTLNKAVEKVRARTEVGKVKK